MRSKQCFNLGKLNIILLSKSEVDDIDNNRSTLANGYTISAYDIQNEGRTQQ